jgi:hypothetical protein
MSITFKARHLVAVTVAVVVLAAGTGALAGGGFTDVGPSHPFRQEILAIRDAGITTGFEDGTYRPGQAVSRGAMAAFMGRGFGRVQGATGSGTIADPSPPAAQTVVASLQLAAGATEQGGGYVLVNAEATFSVLDEADCPCPVALVLSSTSAGTVNGGGTIIGDDDVFNGQVGGHATATAVFPIGADALETYELRAFTPDLTATADISVNASITALYVPFDGLGNVAPV